MCDAIVGAPRQQPQQVRSSLERKYQGGAPPPQQGPVEHECR